MSSEISHYSGIRKFLAGALGNIVEFYDLAIYAFLAPIIAHHFFPFAEGRKAYIYTFIAYAITFLVRPIGGIYLSRLADIKGRRPVMLYSISAMLLASAAMALMPTYEQVYYLAPLLLIVIRIIQGLSSSVEMMTSIAYFCEHAPSGHRGLCGSLAFVSGTAGLLLSVLVILLVRSLQAPSTLYHWGWRLPYLGSIALCSVRYYLIRYLAETPDYLRAKISNSLPTSPLREAVFQDRQSFLPIMVITSLGATIFFASFVYFPTHLYLSKQMSFTGAMMINVQAMLLYIVMLLFLSFCFDRLKNQSTLIVIGALLVLLLSYPLWKIMNASQSDAVAISLGIDGFVIMLACINAPLPAILSALFQKNYKISAITLCHGSVLTVFGGLTPVVFLYCIARTNNLLFPSCYFMFFAALTLFVLLRKKHLFKGEKNGCLRNQY